MVNNGFEYLFSDSLQNVHRCQSTFMLKIEEFKIKIIGALFVGFL